MSEQDIGPQLLKTRPRSILAQELLWLRGRPYRLTGRPYALPIFDDWQNPDKPRWTVLMTGRQVEKTTIISALMVLHVALQAYQAALYTAPRPDYVTDFSNTRFKYFLWESPAFRHLLMGSGVVDQVFHKVLRNLSTAYFRSVFLSADKARGLPVQFLAVDEMQGMQADHLPVIEETQSHYPNSYRIYAGTPLTFDNTLSAYYEASTMCEWACKCSAGHWNFMGMKNIGPEGPICGKTECRRPMNTTDGGWVPQVKDAPYNGYHFNQLMVPWLQDKDPETLRNAWDEILKKLKLYPERQFRNEVLGEPFHVGEALMSPQDYYQSCEQYRMAPSLKESGIAGRPKVFMGVDWGGVGKSQTAVSCFGQYTLGRNPKPRWLYGKYFSGHLPEREVDEIVKLARKWNVCFVAADHGNGHMKNRELQRALAPIPVIDFHISGQTARVVKFMAGERRYILSRVESLNMLYTDIRAGKIGLPQRQDVEPFIKDLCSQFEEYSDKTRMVKYDHKPGQIDDMLHALNMSYIAWAMHHQRIQYSRSKK